MALSNVSSAGALKNLEAEIPHWDFNKTYEETSDKWNDELSKIEVETFLKNKNNLLHGFISHQFIANYL